MRFWKSWNAHSFFLRGWASGELTGKMLTRIDADRVTFDWTIMNCKIFIKMQMFGSMYSESLSWPKRCTKNRIYKYCVKHTIMQHPFAKSRVNVISADVKGWVGKSQTIFWMRDSCFARFHSYAPLKKITQLWLIEFSSWLLLIAARRTFQPWPHIWAKFRVPNFASTGARVCPTRCHLKSVVKRDSVNLGLALPSKDIVRVSSTVPVRSWPVCVLNVSDTLQMGAAFGRNRCASLQQSLATTSLTNSRLFLALSFCALTPKAQRTPSTTVGPHICMGCLKHTRVQARVYGFEKAGFWEIVMQMVVVIFETQKKTKKEKKKRTWAFPGAVLRYDKRCDNKKSRDKGSMPDLNRNSIKSSNHANDACEIAFYRNHYGLIVTAREPERIMHTWCWYIQTFI